MTPRAPSDAEAGMTLLELTAVMAVFSVVALLGIQLLSSGLASRDRVTRLDARMAEVGAAAAVLRRDVAQMVPIPGPGGRPPFRAEEGELAFATASGGAATEIVWRHDPAERTLRRVTAPLGSEAAGRGGVILAGVSGWSAAVPDDAAGWMPARDWRADGPAALPRAVEVVWTLDGLGVVRLVEAR